MLNYYAKRMSAWFLPDPAYATLAFLKNHRRFPRTPPVVFNEFLRDLKSSGDLVKFQRYADKIAVRDHVARRIGARYLVPLHGTADRLTRSVWDGLPAAFMLKTNHGSGWNRPVWNKRAEDYRSVAAQAHGWLDKNFYYVRREQQYKNIKPVLLFEKLITSDKNEVLLDYQFFCFHGTARFIRVGFSNDKERRVYYDRNWAKLDVIGDAARDNGVPRPALFDDMIGVAEALARDLNFVRVDLYCVGRRIFFGELTFVPDGGGGRFASVEFEECLGKMWAGEDADLTRFHYNEETTRVSGGESLR